MGFCRDCCLSPACACCCSIFSVWAVIVLVAIGAALNFNYRKVDNYEIPNEDVSDVATQCYIAAAVYTFFVIFGAARFYLMRRSGRA